MNIKLAEKVWRLSDDLRSEQFRRHGVYKAMLSPERTQEIVDECDANIARLTKEIEDLHISDIEKDKICARYAEVFSGETEFNVSSSVSPEEYKEMQIELKHNLFEICKQVIDFISEDYDVIPKNYEDDED